MKIIKNSPLGQGSALFVLSFQALPFIIAGKTCPINRTRQSLVRAFTFFLVFIASDERGKSDRYYKSFFSWDQLVLMLFWGFSPVLSNLQFNSYEY